MKKILVLFLACLLPLQAVWLAPAAQADRKVIDGTTNIEDNYITAQANATNYGDATVLWQTTYSGYDQYPMFRCLNVATEIGAGATITACSLYAYCTVNQTDDNVSIYRVLKPWLENTATWLDWDAPPREWTIAGCACANDDGVDNSTDDGDCDASTKRDRHATALDTKSVTTASTWYAWDVGVTLGQAWYDGTYNEEGVIMVGNIQTGENRFYSSEYSSNQPYFVFLYTTEEAAVFPSGRIYHNTEIRKTADVGVQKILHKD